MREIRDHVVSGDQAVQLKIEVVDAPGTGGANHVYLITGLDLEKNPSYEEFAEEAQAVADGRTKTVFGVVFQNGAIKEAGVNGVTHEALLAIVIDRLRAFQAGPYACEENDIALKSCQIALAALQERTVARIARGVEGTLAK